MTSAEARGEGLRRRAILGGTGVLAMPGIAWAQGAAAPAVPVVNGIVIGRDGWLYGNWDSALPVVSARITRTLATAVEAGRIMKAAGLQVAISVPPSRARTYADFLPAGLSLSRERQERYAQTLRELRAAGLIVPDISAAFDRLRRSAPATLLTFKADSHWTPEAAEAAAEEMARAIAAANIQLPRADRPGTPPVAGERTEHPNDLAGRLPPADRRAYPPELFAPRLTRSGDGGGLTGPTSETPPDVIVVGSSYMQPRYGFAARLSAAMNRPVGLTWAVHNRGPYRTLLDAVTSDGFKQRRPKLIIWNLLEMDAELGPERGDVWREAITHAAFIEELRRSLAA